MNSIKTHVRKIRRPVRAVQFGEGNFLRAFVDYMLDIANEQGVFEGSIAVVKPRAGGSLEKFSRQDCLYTVLLRGREDGEAVDRARIVTCIDQAASPYEDRTLLQRLGEMESVQYILSNTTEAGICLTGDEQLSDAPCISFPGKLTQLLHARYLRFGGTPASAVTVLPTELIEKNGDRLRECILLLAEKWALGADFARWIREDCLFVNTLVDRIVTGFPENEGEALESRLGYRDELITACEPFGLWVIECGDPAALGKKLPLHQIGLPVIYTRDLSPYRERKVRILNGAHTASVPAAYLAGEEIVRGMMHNPVTRAFVNRAVYDELLPTVPLPADEVRAFAGAVMERFDNPYIDHQLLAISLNSVSKWRARVLPSLTDTHRATGRLPKCLAFSLSALIAFYTPFERGEDCLTGLRNGAPYPIRDEKAVLDFFWENRARLHDPDCIRSLLARRDFWGMDLNEIPSLSETVTDDLMRIRTSGMIHALLAAAEE